MTEPELEALGERLRRIWQREESGEVTKPHFETSRGWKGEPDQLSLVCRVTAQVSVTCWFFIEEFVDMQVSLEWRSYELSFWNGEIRCFDTSGADEPSSDSSLRLAQFAAEWMPFFRRGCWLSGCSIEASAHEKAEWIRGFTKEEIESWKLKM